MLVLALCLAIDIIIFWATICKTVRPIRLRPTILPDRRLSVLSVLSVLSCL